MKLRIILYMVVPLIPHFSIAQAVSDSSIKRAIDFLNCKTLELAVKDNSSLTEKFHTKCDCEKVDYKLINSFVNSNFPSNHKTKVLSEEIEKVKQNSFKQPVESIITFLTEDIFNDNLKYKNIYAFGQKRKNSLDFENYKKNLKLELVPILSPIDTNKSLKGNHESDKKAGASDNSSEKKEIDVENNSFFSSIINYLAIVSFILSLFALWLSANQKRMNKFIKNRFIQFSKADDFQAFLHNKVSEIISKKSNINSKNSSSNFDIQDSIKRINDLELQVHELKEKIQYITISQKSNEKSVELSKQNNSENREMVSTLEVFYLSSPNSDGSFNESSASSNYREGATIYKFTKDSRSHTSFQIDERESSIKFALAYPDKCINPVCDSENEFESKYNRIKTIDAGRAELKNGKWIITKKARIRYVL